MANGYRFFFAVVKASFMKVYLALPRNESISFNIYEWEKNPRHGWNVTQVSLCSLHYCMNDMHRVCVSLYMLCLSSMRMRGYSQIALSPLARQNVCRIFQYCIKRSLLSDSSHLKSMCNLKIVPSQSILENGVLGAYVSDATSVVRMYLSIDFPTYVQ